MEASVASSRTRSFYGEASRPTKNVASPDPLSENSAFLVTDDPKSYGLIARKENERLSREREQRQAVAARRQGRQQELARRVCERETIENYIQTPAAVKRGSEGMAYGVNVYDSRIAEMRNQFTKAEKFGAVAAVGRLEKFMRQSCLRVADLFAFVDHDCSGSVDRKELRAAFNYLKLELPDSHFEALFRYLDESGNGIVEASELENALRHHRRFHFCRSLVEKHEASAREAARLRSADATTNRAATAPGGGTPGANSRPATSSSNDNGGNNVESGTGFPLMSPMKGSTGIGRGQSYNDDSLGGGEGGGLGETFGASGAATGGAVLQNGGIGLSDYRRSPALGRLVTTYPADYPAPGPVLKGLTLERERGRGGVPEATGSMVHGTMGSLPLAGQKLLAGQLAPQDAHSLVALGGGAGEVFGPAPNPRTVWDLQADAAMRASAAKGSRAKADLHHHLKERRQATRDALAKKTLARHALEQKVRGDGTSYI